MNNRIFQKAINLVFTLALAFGLLLPGSTTLALPRPDGAPNDPLYSSQWNLSNRPLPDEPPSDIWGINAPRAWDITTGEAIVVAVIDSGLGPNVDLDTNRILAGYDFINDSATPAGDFFDPGDWCASPEAASSWHGTHIAGIIGAKSNDSTPTGVAGINWYAKILPVRVSGTCGAVTAKDLMDGMSWSANTLEGFTNTNVANVINVSVGVPGQSCTAIYYGTTTYQEAITKIINKGIVIVAAAGDGGSSSSIDFPANCAGDGFITVAATDKLGSRASFSNYGSAVEISAPGGGNGQGDVISTTNSGIETPNSSGSYSTYTGKQGTGIAAAHVSGVVSLMLSANPAMTPSQIEQTLKKTAQAFPSDVGIPCNTSLCGSGIVDAKGALKPDLIITNVGLAPLLSGVCQTTELNYKPLPNEAFCVNITVKNQGGSNSGSVVYPNVFVDSPPVLDTDNCPTDNGIYPPNWNVSIAKGLESILRVPITAGLPAGAHIIYPYTDAQCIVGESIEDNNSFAPISNVGGTVVNVSIGGDSQGDYPLTKGAEKRLYYPVSGGPVKVGNLDGTKIIAAIRLQSMDVLGNLYSFSETMGVPKELLSDKYYFPTYNNTWAPLNSQVRFANLGASPTDIRVTIGGTIMDTYYDVPAQGEMRLYYAVSGGPVIVESLDGTKIIAAIRLQSMDASGNLYSFAETMGMPFELLSDTYYFPTYNNTWAPLNSQIRFANLGTVPTDIQVTIGGNVVGTYTDVPAQGEIRDYYNVSGGPVKVESLDGTKIIAAIRLQSMSATGTLYSFVETMGVPKELVTDKYYFPTYNNTWAPLNSQVRFANLGTSPTDIRVTIGGTVMHTYTSVPAQGEIRDYYNVSGGPVIVESLDGTKITAAIRLQSMSASGILYSFTETMGVPKQLLSDTYYLPTYNNTWTPLNSQVRFGVP